MTARLLIIVLITTVSLVHTQNNDSIVQNNSILKDTIIDGQSRVIKTINPIEDSIGRQGFKDHKIAAEMEARWLRELYSTSLYDTIYRGIRQMKYDSIYYPDLPTDTLKKRLKELNAKTPFNIEYNSSLESVIKRYLKDRKRHIEKLIALSAYYFPMFEEELDRQGLPLEMKYLAIVESALDPKAKSRVGATGLWQFMYPTGKMFGLDVNSYVDERSDPVKATEAASKYLKSLYESLGDWDLALAAYNSGPGNVAKAIRRSGGRTNYWNIRHNLPRETAGYVPAFLATMYIFEFAEEHGFKSNGPKMPFIATDTIHVRGQISLAQVAEITNIDMNELEFLNPSYKLGIIPMVKGEKYTLRLPIAEIGKFVANEDAVYAYAEEKFNEKEQPIAEVIETVQTRYRVRRGDYLGKIAAKFGVSVSQIKQWNGIRNNTVRVGQTLKINSENTASIASGSKSTSSKSSNHYTVRNGDSLWSISRKFPGVSVQNIKNWNDISGTNLKPGTKLKIYKG